MIGHKRPVISPANIERCWHNNTRFKVFKKAAELPVIMLERKIFYFGCCDGHRTDSEGEYVNTDEYRWWTSSIVYSGWALFGSAEAAIFRRGLLCREIVDVKASTGEGVFSGRRQVTKS